jgi:hypothetical protein
LRLPGRSVCPHGYREWACHCGRVPCVTSLDALPRAASEFVVTDPDLVIEPRVLAAARRSLDSWGLLLLGKVHGVRENPLLIRALMKTFGLTSLALEWPEDFAPRIQAFLERRWPITRGCGAGTAVSPPVTWRYWPNVLPPVRSS